MPRKIKQKKLGRGLKKKPSRPIPRKRPQKKISRKNLKKTGRKRTAKKRPALFHKNLFVKPEENPIISPKAENNWESWQTFNPGVVLLDGKIHFLYRAMGEDGVSRFGYAASPNGFHIEERLTKPVYTHEFQERSFNVFSYLSGGGWGGSEDPRLVRVGEESNLYMTYTACGDGELRVALTSIGVKDFLNKKWGWKKPIIISPPGQVHKNWVLFPEKIKGRYAILHSVNPEVSIEYLDDLEFNDAQHIYSQHGGKLRKNCWDNWVRGAGPPPLKTEKGWLLFYHALNHKDFGKYKVGAMLLDLKEPTKILHRSKRPVLEPDEAYENNGAKPGIVYMSGAIVKDGELLTYYGGADNHVCVAHANLKEFLEALIKEANPKLKSRGKDLKAKSR